MLNTLRLAWAFGAHRRSTWVLSALALALGVAAMGFVLMVGAQAQRALERDWAGIDVVVGAKGSPLQLVLSGVWHMDVPPGNVPLQAAEALKQHSAVQRAVPISLGDNLSGHRIVGTTADYLALYGMKLEKGRAFAAPMEAVLGAAVTQRLGLGLDARFVGAHGLGAGGELHSESPYRVVGVLAACGCVVDRLVLTPTESVWQTHEKATLGPDADTESKASLAAEREVTMLLIQYRSPLSAVTFPRYVNTQTSMQAASPAFEVTKLLNTLGLGLDVLRGFALAIVAVAAVGAYLALAQSVRERRADLAMLRLLGAPPSRLAGVVLAHSALMATAGWLLGAMLAHGLVAAAAAGMAHASAQAQFALLPWVLEPALGWTALAVALAALLAAVWPAWTAYRVDVAELLQG